MIYLKIPDFDFYDDAIVLTRSFYPGHEITTNCDEEAEIMIEAEIPVKDGRSKRKLHAEFKKKLYFQLVKMTDRTLPWGNMTGVRPSKIAVSMLQDKISEENVRKYFEEEHFVSDDKIDLAVSVAKKELRILQNIDYKNGYSLYVGIPFCPTVCSYCSFASNPYALWEKETDNYLDALIKELSCTADIMKGDTLNSVYFGGGTPTTLSAGQSDRILSELKNLFDMDHVSELTVEAGRPDSITPEKLEVLKKHHVDRISINPQTMNQETLFLMGRHHTVEQITDAYEMARKMGFDNINMDLIVGLPKEDKDKIQYTLDRIKELDPDSITIHSLAVKRAARLNIHKEEYKAMQTVNTEEIMLMTADYATQMNMEPYYMYRQKNMVGNFENVGYSKPGKECIYNVLIMEEKQTILAVGAGASTKAVFYGNGGMSDRIERIENVKDVRSYMSRIDEMIERKRRFFT